MEPVQFGGLDVSFGILPNLACAAEIDEGGVAKTKFHKRLGIINRFGKKPNKNPAADLPLGIELMK